MNFAYTIIYVQDVKATVEFYEQAFGIPCRFLHESGAYAELETGATALAFAQENFTPTKGTFRQNRADEGAAGAEVGFVTANVQEAFEKAVKAGAKPVIEPLVKPWGQTVAYVSDNNGFLVELCTKVGGSE